ncbi:MAG: Flp pilus assembly complex ATPase component TadA [Myxococcales bacterium]|nr:Flp pilus assembly complex ATPase component TadA [Myxococcales bacterium]
MAVSIIISEKGGAERRELYDQPEVSIGRVKGNDILLPKGNVSKRHARLIFRDGRCIVTDLKSTNGTYVNHRRITHATLVRDGDRIYIGDFVVRVEGEPTAGHDLSRTTLGGLDAPSEPSISSRAQRMIAPAIASTGPATPEVVSHFPIEHDPDESSPLLEVPGPPRVPAGLRPIPATAAPAPGDAPSTAEPYAPPPHQSSEPAPGQAHSSSSPQPDGDRLALLQRCLDELVAALEASGAWSDDSAVPESERVAALETEAARIAQAAGGEIDLGALCDAARRELVDLGPLAALIEDASVSELHVLGTEISVVRRGRRTLHRGLGFSTDRALARALDRLAARSGVTLDPRETSLHVLLDTGVELCVVRPPASPTGHLVSLRKALRCEGTLNGLVRSGAISRGMATLLGHSAIARANVLVTSAPGAGAEELLGALADAASLSGGRVVWLLDGRQVPPAPAASIEMGRSAGERLRALEIACRLGPAHLVVPALTAPEIGILVDAVAEGLEGVVMRASAPTLRQAIARLSADLASCTAGGSTEAARERLLSAFDIVLEVARLRDGRLRVLRLAELRAGVAGGIHITDIFSFSYHRTAAGGSIEGSFVASGAIPSIVEELAGRGMPMDTSIFRRHPSG